MRPFGRPALVVLLASLGASSCSKSSPAAPDPTPVATTTITITSAGASPKNVEVPVGSRVLFINQDSRAHNMTSDPHPEHNDCLEVNDAGFLQPGQSRETGNLVQVRSCGFHDHDNPNNTSLSGRIVIR